MALPGAVSALRGLLIDSRGEKLTHAVFEAFSGQPGSIPVLAPAPQEDGRPESSPYLETENRCDESMEQTEETLHDRA